MELDVWHLDWFGLKLGLSGTDKIVTDDGHEMEKYGFFNILYSSLEKNHRSQAIIPSPSINNPIPPRPLPRLFFL